MANLTQNQTLFDQCTPDSVIDPIFACANQATGGDYALMVMMISFGVPFMIALPAGFMRAIGVGAAFMLVMSIGLLVGGFITGEVFIFGLVVFVLSVALNRASGGGRGSV